MSRLFRRRANKKPEAQDAQDERDDQNDFSASPFRASWSRRCMVLLMLKTTARFYERLGCCIPISRHLIVKKDTTVHLTEAATLRYVAAKTSTVPVPRVYCAFEHKGQTYIVMERIRGESVHAAYRKLESPDDRARLLAQLRSIFQELRSLPPPSSAKVSSCVGGSLFDCRIPHARNARFGPFASIQSFHLWLRRGAQLEELERANWKEDRENIDKMIVLQDTTAWPPPVFTHGDLNPSNILVKDGQVAGIIDWETSGWYPFYWEYTSAFIVNQLRTEWQALLAEFLDPCSAELLQMEITREIWWGQG